MSFNFSCRINQFVPLDRAPARLARPHAEAREDVGGIARSRNRSGINAAKKHAFVLKVSPAKRVTGS